MALEYYPFVEWKVVGSVSVVNWAWAMADLDYVQGLLQTDMDR